MDTKGEEAGDDDKLLFRAEVFQIVGCAAVAASPGYIVEWLKC
jgi:hypothetical protein